MEEAITNFDPFVAAFIGKDSKNTIVNMFNKQKSKSENYRIMTGVNSVGIVKSIEQVENQEKLDLD